MLAWVPATNSSNMLNVVYNLAGFVSKIGFGVIIWQCAVSESDKR